MSREIVHSKANQRKLQVVMTVEEAGSVERSLARYYDVLLRQNQETSTEMERVIDLFESFTEAVESARLHDST